MELSPFWEPASRSATQEFTNILCNLKMYYGVHKVPILAFYVPNFMSIFFCLSRSKESVSKSEALRNIS
jgi:hypothetical protein